MHILDLLFPPVSLSGEHGIWVTEDERLALAEAPLRLECMTLRRRGMESLDRLVAAAPYAGFPLLRVAVQRFKYKRIRALESELGRLLAEAASFLEAPKEAVLCPVPLHWTREWSRGFNQSEALARKVSEAYGWDVIPLLRRTRMTGQQAKRTLEERKTALRDAFAIRKHAELPKQVILVDDICTSGTTLQECASVLKQAGVERVTALTLALG